MIRFKVTAGQLEDLVQTNHIVHGLNRPLLAQIAANPKPFYHQKVAIATGTKQIEGQNGYIKFIFDFDEDEKKPLRAG